jgi:predicted HTH domain antitoxin
MVLIEDDILQSAKLTEREIRLELAIALYAQQRLSFGQARKLAGLSHPEFEKVLYDRGIPSHYDVPEFEEDLKTIQQLHELRHGSRQ